MTLRWGTLQSSPHVQSPHCIHGSGWSHPLSNLPSHPLALWPCLASSPPQDLPCLFLCGYIMRGAINKEASHRSTPRAGPLVSGLSDCRTMRSEGWQFLNYLVCGVLFYWHVWTVTGFSTRVGPTHFPLAPHLSLQGYRRQNKPSILMGYCKDSGEIHDSLLSICTTYFYLLQRG